MVSRTLLAEFSALWWWDWGSYFSAGGFPQQLSSSGFLSYSFSILKQQPWAELFSHFEYHWHLCLQSKKSLCFKKIDMFRSGPPRLSPCLKVNCTWYHIIIICSQEWYFIIFTILWIKEQYLWECTLKILSTTKFDAIFIFIWKLALNSSPQYKVKIETGKEKCFWFVLNWCFGSTETFHSFSFKFSIKQRSFICLCLCHITKIEFNHYFLYEGFLIFPSWP